MSHTVWLVIVFVAVSIAYHHGFEQGDLDRRLKSATMLGQMAADEKARHFKEENYWQDKAEDCLATQEARRP